MRDVPYPRERVKVDGLVPTAPPVTCASCRRSVVPEFVAGIGATCGTCGAVIPKLKMPKPPGMSKSMEPMSEEEVARQVVAEVLAEAGSMEEVYLIEAAGIRVVATAIERDADRAERQERAQVWRDALPELARSMT